MRLKALVILSLLLLAACRTDPAPPTPPPETGDFSLLLAKDGLSVTPGGVGNVAVTVVAEDGFDKAVAFSVVGAPLGLSATFAPPASANQSTLTLNLPATQEVKTYDFFVKGSATVNGALLEHTAPLKLTVTAPPGISVSGVVRNALGNPLADAVVRLGRKTATTGAGGKFSLSEVTTPYTLVVQPAGGSVQHEFVNLTRPDPTLVLLAFTGGAPLTGKATVTGELSGATFPVPEGQVGGVAFAGSGDARGNAGLTAGAGPGYSLEATWSGSSSVSGTLYALYGTLNPAVSSLTASYSGFARREVTLSNSGLLGGQDLSLEPVPNSALSVKLTLPAGAALQSKSLFLNLGPESFFLLGSDPGADLISTYPTPVVPGKTLNVSVKAVQGDRTILVQRAGLAANEVLDIALPAAVAPLTPADGALNVPQSATLTWGEVSDSVYVIVLDNDKRVVYTASDTYSTSLSANTLHTWYVLSLAPFSSLDDLAGARWSAGYPSPGDDQNLTATTSELMSFETTP